MDSITVRYSEIATKGKNRVFFERVLIRNIRKALGREVKKVYRRHGRIVCALAGRPDNEKIIRILERLPGIVNFSFAVKSGLRMDSLKRLSLKSLKDEEFATFRVTAKRSNKEFRKTSREVNEILGEHIIRNMGKKVKLKNPDKELFVEIAEKEAFVSCKRYHGMGGLPVGSGGKVASSLSGGIDSPVAASLMMKRGCRVVFVHIYNKTIANEGVLKKLDDIVRQLTGIQLSSRLYVVPFEEIQKEIIMNIPSRFRMIVYRRFMMEIINRIAGKEDARGIVTGDSIGQVASQTLENLTCIHGASELPVFSPLIGMNKEEIVGIGKKIGTYEYSIMPYPDCCSYNVAQHPETRARLDEITRLEESIKKREELISDSISKSRIKTFTCK